MNGRAPTFWGLAFSIPKTPLLWRIVRRDTYACSSGHDHVNFASGGKAYQMKRNRRGFYKRRWPNRPRWWMKFEDNHGRRLLMWNYIRRAAR